MVPESRDDYTIYLDGVQIAQEEIQLTEIRVPEEVQEPGSGPPCEYMECTLHFKIPKRWRCRGRKRFVKLMMSEGIRRNYARWLADFTRTLMPYREAWRNHLLHKF